MKALVWLCTKRLISSLVSFIIYLVQILVEGHSEQQPLRGDLCKINLIGKLENGTVVEELIGEIIQIGDVEVVQGVDMAVALMKIGEKAEIACEPRFAYSALGLKNEDEPSKTIPGNAKVNKFNRLLFNAMTNRWLMMLLFFVVC